jgi:hypothetical protein
VGGIYAKLVVDMENNKHDNQETLSSKIHKKALRKHQS